MRHELSCAREPGNLEWHASLRRAADLLDRIGHERLATLLRRRAWESYKASLDAEWRKIVAREEQAKADREAAGIERMRRELGL